MNQFDFGQAADALRLFTERVAESGEAGEVLRAVVAAAEVAGAARVSLFILEGGTLRTDTGEGSEGALAPGPDAEADAELAQRVYRTGRSGESEDGTVTAVPLPDHGRVAGALVAAAPLASDQGWSHFLETLGNVAGMALGRARAVKRLGDEILGRQRAEGRLRALRTLTEGPGGERLVEQLVRTLAEDFGAQRVEVSRLAGGQVRPELLYERGELRTAPGPEPEEGPGGADGVPDRAVFCTSRAWERFPHLRVLQRSQFETFLCAPLKDGRGEPLGVLTVCATKARPDDPGEHDLLELYAQWLAAELERGEAGRSLVEARRALDALIRNIPGAVYRCGAHPSRPVEFVSQGSRKVTGYPADAFSRSDAPSLGDLVVAEDRARVGRELERALEERGAFELEYRIHDRQGNVRWLYDVGSVVGDESGGRFVEGVLLDHTERRVLEEELTHSQRMEALGRLAGGVAHDFNNLLTAISGYAELLGRRFPEGDRSARAVNEIIRAADRAAELTRQLLAFSRRQALEPRLVSLNETVTGVLRMLGRLLGEDVEVHLDLATDVGSVKADPGQLEQVVLNLCLNARDALPDGGRLTLRTTLETVGGDVRGDACDLAAGEYAVLEVADTGVGMGDDVLQHIFEPFFTTKEPGQGTGLGLATVYGVVKQAGGDVAVTSSPGEGSSFRIYWPKEARRTRPVRPAEEASPPLGWGKTVLLVEDDEPVRRLVAEHLQGLGFRIVAAEEGADALKILRGTEVLDLLVTDVVMPGLGGPELARFVRSERPDLPVVFVSGHSAESVLAPGVEQADFRFLQKPFRLSDLTAAVEAALDRLPFSAPLADAPVQLPDQPDEPLRRASE